MDLNRCLPTAWRGTVELRSAFVLGRPDGSGLGRGRRRPAVTTPQVGYRPLARQGGDAVRRPEVERDRSQADLEPIAKQAVLLGEDGTITPLLSDEASRALFLDDRLRNRPAEVRGQRYAGVPYLQVINFKVEREGRLETPEYFCEVCAISVRYPQVCPCCQGPMELRMKPDRR